MRPLILAGCLSLTVAAQAQANKAKLGVLLVPLPSGFGIGMLGYERINNTGTKSWQLYLNVAGGAIGNDAPEHNRKWVTVERTFYNKKTEKKFRYSFSGFTEIGNRVTEPGFSHFPQDSVLQKTTAFEINPGVNLGLHYRFSKKFGVEIQAGPKLIIANGKKHYINTITLQKFDIQHNEIRAGWMFTGNLYFQF